MSIDKLALPQAIESEKGIIGSILVDPDLFIEIADLLDSSDFFLETHQQVWEACKNLTREGVSLDLVTIGNQLKKQDALLAGKVLTAKRLLKPMTWKF